MIVQLMKHLGRRPPQLQWLQVSAVLPKAKKICTVQFNKINLLPVLRSTNGLDLSPSEFYEIADLRPSLHAIIFFLYEINML